MDTESSIRAIARSISVLQAINRSASLTVSEIAESSRIPYPTATRIIRTLVNLGMIEKEPSRKKYRPTALTQSLSCGFQNHDRLVSVARPHIVELTQRFGWPVSVATRVGKVMVVRDSTSSMTPLTFTHYFPGWQVPLITSASGRAYLSYADALLRQKLLAHLLETGGPADRLAVQEFLDGNAAEKIRSQGYAAVARTPYSLNPGKTSSLAVPLHHGGELLGSLAMVFFASSVSIAKATSLFLGALTETASEIGKAMESSHTNLGDHGPGYGAT
ncbi:MAG TPA: helix-turn-helix domain-containing protein [Pedomonas sp.]|uniref:helix-turn-helix domain-containing protein n=1 Tax=Pedomonas sp. TaxID=2976421 RepID=UPI002F3F112A